MTREEALAICSANLKGSHDKDLLGTARALSFLSSHPERLSSGEVGKLVGVTGSMVRQFLGLLRLPEAIQRMIEAKQLDLDRAVNLGRLRKRPVELQLAAAEAVVGITAKRARLFVSELRANPHLSLPEAMERAAAKEMATEPRVRLEVMLPKEQHHRLEEQAQRRGMQVAALATEVLGRWLESAREESPT